MGQNVSKYVKMMNPHNGLPLFIAKLKNSNIIDYHGHVGIWINCSNSTILFWEFPSLPAIAIDLNWFRYPDSNHSHSLYSLDIPIICPMVKSV